MRFRCFLWPNNLPNHLTCKCGKPLLFTHLLNCKHFITFRSKVHNNVRDQIYVMCKSYRVDSFLEPLLSKLILDDPNIDSTRYNRASMGLTRGNLVVPGLNGSFTILDAMSIDPCNSSNEHFINSDVNNPLLAGEKYKIAKYAKPISSVNENSHAQYNLCPFVFSLLGSLGKAAMAFLEDFVVVVKERTGRIFNRVYWQNRIVFSIYKGMVTLISDSLSSFGKFSESLAINCFDVGEAEKCICSNSPLLTLRHALNCSKLITYRSSLHDAVRDTVFNMAQTARISFIKEPLLKKTLSLNNFGSDDRGDVYCDWIDNSEAIVDFV
ncbi:hypothetical protein P9112_007229 [Eukaryota sp. TZLM1-RC]